MEPLTKIEVGVAATRYGSPGKINSLLQLRGVLAFEEHVNRLDTAIKKQVKADAQDLRSKGVVAILRGTSEYPKLLDLVPNAPPVLFCCGQLSLLNSPV